MFSIAFATLRSHATHTKARLSSEDSLLKPWAKNCDQVTGQAPHTV